MKKDEVKRIEHIVQWSCVATKEISQHYKYGRFVLCPLREGQAETIAISLRKTLLSEVEGICITHVNVIAAHYISYDFSRIVGVKESVAELLTNLQQIVLKNSADSDSDSDIFDASICVKGPRHITSKDIILPPSLDIVDDTQHIATLALPIELCLELKVERIRGSCLRREDRLPRKGFPIIPLYLPIRKINYSIKSFGETLEILTLEIWTNGSYTPKEALWEACRHLVNLTSIFFNNENQNISLTRTKNMLSSLTKPYSPQEAAELRITAMKLQMIFVEQLHLDPTTLESLQRAKILTLYDLFHKSTKELMKIAKIEDVIKIVAILQKWNII
uniref:RNA polymerase alpha subunit n=3 Tax=Berberis TaxID=22774 RepID=A0A8K1T1P8_9MAGN|nr:RpoA [Berberis alpicola]YP_010863301.1 RpoA [Berberis alpicola]QIQ57020.1 RNA polymerase alpha subunit [Berberis aristata]QYF07577.1 RNA polymerase alpha subunit [Prinsepia utilis]UFY98317.1 RNA polymerase alpha subunit [Berberis diaphana]UHJ17296.1 RNA polymerase alpha subunit [Berberis dasystachya]UFY98359.1 RNA polymerase alpha subunit [Berberis diaphana]